MRVNVIIIPPTTRGCFADVKLSFMDVNGTTRVVDIGINFQSLHDFSKSTTSTAFDFFLISSIVYGVDNLLERYQYSVDAWARDIQISFPVNNPAIWNHNKVEFDAMLSFLTGDYWDVSFIQLPAASLFIEKTSRWSSSIQRFDYLNYTFASLFSGGLDSLVGVIDGIENLQISQKGLLISHFDSTSPGANSDQERLYDYLSKRQEYRDKIDWIQETVFLRNYDNADNALTKESSYRSRSLLFIGIGIYCIENIPNCNTLTIPENGTISLNYPLTPSRVSTLSTRTTHPYYIQKLQHLINNVGLTTQLHTPYHLMTKGELVESCTNETVLYGIYSQSVSCGKRGRKQHWDVRTGTQHCGVCMPCIYRRAALHKKNLDNQLYGIDIFTTQRDVLTIQDMPALFDFLKRRLTTEQIKRTLLVSGSIDLNDLDNCSGLVERVRVEIKQWISDKGNNTLKTLAGII
ncbi:MAG: Qat anti-phage system QueC-like protein QatC [Sphingobacteriaceae bacterium]